jgi:hypothetical protein
VIAAAELLAKDYGVRSEVLSAPSWNELRREALDCERWNLLHPVESPRVPLRGEHARRSRRAVRGGERLRAQRTGADPPVGAGRYVGARHGRLRSLRCPRGPARTTSRSIAGSSSLRRCGRWPTTASSASTWCSARSLALGIDVGQAQPARFPDGTTDPWRLPQSIVPDLGSFKDVAVIEILVKPGDTLEVDDRPIATLETEKATMDVPSPVAWRCCARCISPAAPR